jgi:hypothetical protein
MDVVELATRFDLPNRINAITAGRLIVNALGHLAPRRALRLRAQGTEAGARSQ